MGSCSGDCWSGWIYQNISQLWFTNSFLRYVCILGMAIGECIGQVVDNTWHEDWKSIGHSLVLMYTENSYIHFLSPKKKKVFACNCICNV